MIKKVIATAIGLSALLLFNLVTHAEDAPALWVVEDTDTTVYLFGTYHMVPNDLDWRTEAIEDAMHDASVTYLEADGLSPEGQAQIQQVIGRTGFNPEGLTLSAQLGPERAAAFAELATRFGLPMDQLERLRPWLAVVSITQAIYAQLGLDAKSIDALIYKQSLEQNDEIRFLETPTEQISALSALSGEEMLRHVDLGIDNMDDLQAYTDDLLAAWVSGDIVALEALVIAKMQADAPGLFQSIFVTRNEDWAEQIASLIDGDGRYFVAVGAGHLVGDDSVIATLQGKGISVERLQ